VDELRAAYAQAYNARLDQAVADGRLTLEQADLLKGEYALYNNPEFQASLQLAFEAAVSQAVSAGVITQAQADQILANRSGMGFGRFDGLDGGFGGGRGRHGGGVGRFGFPGVTPDTLPAEPETPTETAPSNGL
jgi:hypothetical protein